MTPAAGDLVADKYRLLRPLASGGMGSIWVARHESLGRDVALKFISGVEHSAEEVRRFTLEARAAASVQGRHLVHIYDFGFDAERPYLVMEWLRGESLAALAARQAPLAPRVVVDLLEQLTRGLRLVHAAGIVHRDIKPSNLFLVREGTDHVLKLLDFGIAKSEHGSTQTTTTGTLLGSPGYMSPEQARGNSVDERSDLWSVAVVLFELLSGRSLFGSTHVGDAIARICSEPVPPLSAFAPQLRQFDAFFAKALCRDPSSRFANSDELLAAFRRAALAGDGDASLAASTGPVSIAEQPTLAAEFDPSKGRDCATASLLATGQTASTGVALPAAASVRPRIARSLGWATALLVVGAAAWFVAERTVRDVAVVENAVEPSPTEALASGVATAKASASMAVERNAAEGSAESGAVEGPSPGPIARLSPEPDRANAQQRAPVDTGLAVPKTQPGVIERRASGHERAAGANSPKSRAAGDWGRQAPKSTPGLTGASPVDSAARVGQLPAPAPAPRPSASVERDPFSGLPVESERP